MPVTATKVDDPCQECRDRHLKCDDEGVRCKNCERLGKPCERTKGKPKFRFGSSARYDQTFSKDQVWLGQSRTAKLQFVDQGPELENYYAADDHEHQLFEPDAEKYHPHKEDDLVRQSMIAAPLRTVSLPASQAGKASKVAQVHHANTSALLSPAAEGDEDIWEKPPSKRRRTDENDDHGSYRHHRRPKSADLEPSRFYAVNDFSRSTGYLGRPLTASSEEHQAELRKVYAEYDRLEDEQAAWVPPDELLSPAVWKRYFFWPNERTTMQCACLMRYFTDRLGPWLDIGDPSRHFTLIVPQRARRCPPLLNAIFTVAARHLTHLSQHRNNAGLVQYHGNVMPKLDRGFAIKYQNASIAYLRELCKHPEHVQDEDLLAATVILRYYDEFEALSNGSSDETVFRSMQLFVAAQSDRSFLSPIDYEPINFSVPGAFSNVRDEVEVYLKSYQHSSFRIALRQECARAFMKQKPIGLDFTSWSVLQGFDEADDFVWADRHLYHLACVLQFCFPGEAQGQRNAARWHELKQFESQWEEYKPMSFAAIHYRSSNAAASQPMPEVWYLSDIHAAATQYFHLSRILLIAYDPTIRRLGPGAAIATKKVSQDVQKLVLELCGIATSMPGSEPALLQASMAIAVCGEHFSDPTEQEALVKILHQLEVNHGFPTRTTEENLKESWR